MLLFHLHIILKSHYWVNNSIMLPGIILIWVINISDISITNVHIGITFTFHQKLTIKEEVDWTNPPDVADI